MLTSTSSILALDVGERRIGVARANAVAYIAGPLTTIQNDEFVIDTLQAIVRKENVAVLVLGLPRGLNGQHTDQTAAVEAFGEVLQQHFELPMYWQDEAVTSRKAKAELEARGKPYKKEAIDALAATYILEDFLGDHPEMRV